MMSFLDSELRLYYRPLFTSVLATLFLKVLEENELSVSFLKVLFCPKLHKVAGQACLCLF
jgi:hypothetical protein